MGEEKTVKSTREQQEIYPSSGKNAITKITVEPKDVLLQDKEITENGTYEADKNYDGLGKVTVDVSEAKVEQLYSYSEEVWK